MKEYIFNEKAHVESIINSGYVDDSNVNKTIKKLARYNHYIKGFNSNENYNAIIEYMNKNCSYFSEIGSYSDINGCIRDTAKSAWKDVDKVVITKKELDVISSLNDIRKEKIAFVLLADAKYDNAYKKKNINLSYLSNSDLYRMSRVTMPVGDRSMFLHFLYSDNLVEININPTTKHKKLLFIDESDEDVVLTLTENSYKELAFTYMNWKNKGGYKECKSCGRLFRTKKEGNQVYCKRCAPKHVLMEIKTIVCKCCGQEIAIVSKDNQTSMCETCYKKHRKETIKENVRKFREKNKM